MQTDVHYCANAVGVGFDNLPRLGFSQIFVTQTGNVHYKFQRLAELELLNGLLNALLACGQLVESLAVVVGDFGCHRRFSAVVFLREHNGAVHKVAQNGNQLVVVAGLKILPREVVVLGFRCVGREYIAQNVLFSREIDQILVEPNSPVLRSRNLVAFKVQELVGRHVVGQNVAAVSLHHRREDDAVEHNVVLADKVNQARIVALPPLLPSAPALGVALAEFFGVRYVADGRVEPNVKHFALRSLNWHRNTPLKVARHCPRLKVHIQPRLALSVNI